MLALIITSLARARLGLRSWRLVHWTAYLCWPVAVLHGLGTGTDTPVHWVLALTAGCVLIIAGLTLWRLAIAWPARPVASAAGVIIVVLTLIAASAWLGAGPLSPGWSARSGTHRTQAEKAPLPVIRP